MLHLQPISKYPPYKEEISNPAASITGKRATRHSTIGYPFVSKVTSTSSNWDPEYFLLAEERNTALKNVHQILVSTTFGLRH